MYPDNMRTGQASDDLCILISLQSYEPKQRTITFYFKRNTILITLAEAF